MNEVVLPPAPNWYSDSVLLCTPDKYVIYASRKDIVIIKPTPPTEAAEVNIISNAHSERVLSVSANSVTWGNPHKQIVSVGDDKMVQLWDFETLTSLMSHKAHEANNSQIVAASFAGERIISVAENGQIIVWRISTNTTQTFSNIFGFRVKVMSMATCPHASYITAFGMATGLVVVADLRRTGKVLYRMREHDHDITGLSWCPTPYNIYKTKSGLQLIDSIKKKQSRFINRKMEINDDKITVTLSETDAESQSKPMDTNSEESIVDLTNESSNATDENKMNDFQKIFAKKCEELQTDLAQKEDTKLDEKKEEIIINQVPIIIDDSPKKVPDSDDFKKEELDYPVRSRPVVDKKNPWGNVVFNDSDEEDDEEPKVEVAPKVPPASDFLSECLNLRKKIIDCSQVCEDLENSMDENNAEETSKDLLKDESHPNDENEECDRLEEEIPVPRDSIADYEILGIINDSETKKEEASLTESMQSLTVSSCKMDQNKSETLSNKSNDQLSVTEIIDKCNLPDSELKERSNKLNAIDKVQNYEFDLTLPDPESAKDYLLASVCRAGTICIWRAGSDGRLELQLPKHMKSASSHKKRDNIKNWITICWAQPTLILSSSIWNELLTWDLIPKPNKLLKFQIKSSLIHADHKKFIFQIATPFKLFDTPDMEKWRDDKELSVWTTSQDRWILCTNLSTRCNIACYCTFGGLVNCLSVSQLDPNKVAVAVGDGTIRVWDLSRPHLQTIMMMTFFDKVHTKASYLDWHPVKEKYLAFATCEGRIGEYDLTNKSRSATIYSNFHRSSVYKIQWGPLPDNEKTYGVYSCSLGEFIVHDPARHHKQPYEIKVFEDENVTTFAWKADYSVLAVGTRTGTVKLLTKQFKVLQTLYMQKKSVRCLEWHPLATAYDSGISEFASYLAVATMENDIYIYDCITEENTEATDKKVIVLQGHENAVRNIAWCPHIGGRLVSTCEDGIAIVWDVKTQTILSTYNSAPDCGPSVVWSPLDADLIILGGKTLKIWRITKNPPVLPIVSKKLENKQKRKIIVESQCITAKKTEKLEKEKKKQLLNTLSKHLHDQEFVLKNCRKLIHQLDTKVEKKSKDDSDSDLSDAEEFEDAKENHELDAQVVADPLKLFGSRKDVISVLDYEQTLLLQQKKTTPHGYIGLWKGTMTESIKHAIEMNQIDPWIINMAPMVSHKLWLELCEKYAHNLCEKGEHMEASTYYLSCHKVDEAIETLCQGKYYKEALILANVRLPEGNNTVPALVEKWCKYSAQSGCFEVAAQCYIKMGKFSEAAEILNKRSDKKTLEFAAELAQRAENKDLLSAINLKLEALKNNETSEVKLEGINICESRLEAIIKKSANLEITNGNHEIDE